MYGLYTANSFKSRSVYIGFLSRQPCSVETSTILLHYSSTSKTSDINFLWEILTWNSSLKNVSLFAINFMKHNKLWFHTAEMCVWVWVENCPNSKLWFHSSDSLTTHNARFTIFVFPRGESMINVCDCVERNVNISLRTKVMLKKIFVSWHFVTSEIWI